MSFEPQKFFIGLIDFFSILLPGALLTFLVGLPSARWLLNDPVWMPRPDDLWLTFLFASYLLGHFIFLIGSMVLDEYAYDRIRAASKAAPHGAGSAQNAHRSIFTTGLASLLVSNVDDAAIGAVLRIKDHYLDPLEGAKAMNAFQWTKARLTAEAPEALAAVQRFEADSKFFRSLAIVLLGLTASYLVRGLPLQTLAGAVLLALSFWRYFEQRLKATRLAYAHLINLESRNNQGYRVPPSHAGGVVHRGPAEKREYLLVQSSDGSGEWVLPKGHVQARETTEAAAVREVNEETGVWARIEANLGRVSFLVGGAPVTIQIYLMGALTEGAPAEKRRHEWLSLDEAIQRATHAETKLLLVGQLSPALTTSGP